MDDGIFSLVKFVFKRKKIECIALNTRWVDRKIKSWWMGVSKTLDTPFSGSKQNIHMGVDRKNRGIKDGTNIFSIN